MEHRALDAEATGCQGREAIESVLNLKHLSVSFSTPEGDVEAVRDVSLSLQRGEILAIVGESGCGKSVLCRAAMKLLPRSARISGRIELAGQDISDFDERAMRHVRGSQMAMLFQDPLTTLNPTIPVGTQLMEAVLIHKHISRKAAYDQSVQMLEMAGIPDASQRMHLHPYAFSGGMRQRCVLAIALALKPQVLFADEPTTSLDVTVQARMLDVLRDMQHQTEAGIVLVSHDLGVVARVADRVAVMYAGKIVETGTAEEIFYTPRHPYTWGLLESLPSRARASGELRGIGGMPPHLLNPPPGDAFAERNPYALAIDYEQMPPLFQLSETHFAATWLLDKRAPHIPPQLPNSEPSSPSCPPNSEPCSTPEPPKRCPVRDAQSPLLSVENLRQSFFIRKTLTLHAVKGVSFAVQHGEIFGLVGESGSGKSTIARSIMGIPPPTSGDIRLKGSLISGKNACHQQRRDIQRTLQVLFQDAASALNPRMRVSDLVSEPLRINRLFPNRKQMQQEEERLLECVGLDILYGKSFPGELSGGQRQRVAIARAIAMRPELIIADEPVASLDVSLQAQIINLLQHLHREHGFAFLFIAHDLSLIQYLCERVGVLYDGKLVEVAPTGELFSSPQHAYTQALLSAIPIPDPLRERQKVILSYTPTEDHIAEELVEIAPDHFVAMKPKNMR